MQRIDENDRSLKNHEGIRVQASQVVIVVLLVIVILVAVVLAIPAGWGNLSISDKRGGDTVSQEEVVNPRTLLSEFRSALASLGKSLNNMSEEGATQIAVSTGEVYPSENSGNMDTTYINYDLNITVSLPSGWSYERSRQAFISDVDTLYFSSYEDFTIPDSWERTTTTETYTNSVDNVVTHYYLKKDDLITFIFSTVNTSGFTQEEQDIITSFKEL